MTEQELMLTSILKCRRVDLYTQRPEISDEQAQLLHSMRSRREIGEPLQYIIGEASFCGLDMEVNPSVLIPRPETEVMADHLIQRIAASPLDVPFLVLNIGTGSGCIAIALAHAFVHVECLAVDRSSGALDVARRNAARHGVSHRICFEERDMLVGWEGIIDHTFDLIISNPPYIPTGKLRSLPEDVRHEPVLALDGGADGLDFYRQFSIKAARKLRKNGLLACEFWDGQDEMISEIFQPDWNLAFFKDLSGVNRFFVAQDCSKL